MNTINSKLRQLFQNFILVYMCNMENNTVFANPQKILKPEILPYKNTFKSLHFVKCQLVFN